MEKINILKLNDCRSWGLELGSPVFWEADDFSNWLVRIYLLLEFFLIVCFKSGRNQKSKENNAFWNLVFCICLSFTFVEMLKFSFNHSQIWLPSTELHAKSPTDNHTSFLSAGQPRSIPHSSSAFTQGFRCEAAAITVVALHALHAPEPHPATAASVQRRWGSC